MNLKYKYTAILSVIGIFLALYLFYQFLTPPHNSLCHINEVINCDASTKGPLAKTLGIPTALYGLMGYAVILFASLTKMRKLLFGTATFGFLFCLRITILEIFVIKTYCPVCIACQIDMLLLFIIAFQMLKTKKSEKSAQI